MKKIVVLLFVLVGGMFGRAQTADGYVNVGRGYLGNKDIYSANTAFSNALVLSPTHQTANFLYAATRLAVLVKTPAVSNFLSRLGLPQAGRDIYNWNAKLPVDANNVPVAPATLTPDELTMFLRTNVVASLLAADSNLAAVVDSSFQLNLTENETRAAAVTVDYGDAQVLRAMIHGVEYVIYLARQQNLNAQLNEFRNDLVEGTSSIQEVLQDHPNLFMFSTTNDMLLARSAFQKASDLYFAASQFIRNRSPFVVRLFNLDSVSANSEAQFRSVLQDLNSSLTNITVLSADTNLAVNLKRHFDGKTPWRTLFPHFSGNSTVLGTWSDPTFGGIITGLTAGAIEQALSKQIPSVPAVNISEGGGGMVTLSFSTLINRAYSLETTTNLLDWASLTNFISSGSSSALQVSNGGKGSRKFYRLRDDSDRLVVFGTVTSSATGIPIPGAQVVCVVDGESSTADSNGYYVLVTSVPKYDCTEITASAAGYNPYSSGACAYPPLLFNLDLNLDPH